jgi:hypothetical protein
MYVANGLVEQAAEFAASKSGAADDDGDDIVDVASG